MVSDPTETVNRAGETGWEEKVLQAAHELLIEKMKNKSKGAIQYGHA